MFVAWVEETETKETEGPEDKRRNDLSIHCQVNLTLTLNLTLTDFTLLVLAEFGIVENFNMKYAKNENSGWSIRS